MQRVARLAVCAVLVCGVSSQYVSSFSNNYRPSGPGYPSQDYFTYNPSGTADYYRPPVSSPGITDRLQNIFQGFSDRTDPAFFSAAPFLLLSLLALVGLAVTGVAYAVITNNSSGRGLDSDQWEVDHSVWMNQLQRDFEDSWSTE
ncbi:uncharacterized protein LOC122365961 [Amphibalanus amphitrite]|uniref:uncharacterized protein LOC122365961 n=1 Tax=Amphibalanus amphitrite TaxID=1232801 RepID=UPI001C91D284|nr:uncharacterized protein LOC122365961 [Amphibalanus amphitrite]